MGTVGPIMEAGGDGPPAHGIHLSRPFPHLLSSTDELGHTDMHLAATKGDAKAVRELIEREMPVDTTSERGFSAAHHAARAGHVEVLHVLHERVPKLLSNPSNEGITVVHLAALRYLWEVVPRVFEVVDQNGCTAAHWAAADGGLGVLKFLRERVPHTTWTEDEQGYTPADYAAMRGHLPKNKFLMGLVTPLMCAAREGNAAEVVGLLQRGADPTIVLNGSTRFWVPKLVGRGVLSSTAETRCEHVTGPTNGFVKAKLEDGTVVEVPGRYVRQGKAITAITLARSVKAHRHPAVWQNALDQLVANFNLRHGEGFSEKTRHLFPIGVRTRMLALAMSLEDRRHVHWPRELWFRVVAALFCLCCRDEGNPLNWQRDI